MPERVWRGRKRLIFYNFGRSIRNFVIIERFWECWLQIKYKVKKKTFNWSNLIKFGKSICTIILFTFIKNLLNSLSSQKKKKSYKFPKIDYTTVWFIFKNCPKISLGLYSKFQEY